MTSTNLPDIDLTVYPDECDAYGHLNQASFLALFERARWEMLARGPGMDVFSRTGAWPAVRKTVVEYHAGAFPGDVLRFQQALIHHGRTSFTMRQTARRVRDDALIATAELVFVCVGRDGRPVPAPQDFIDYLSARRVVVASGRPSPDGQRVTADVQRLAPDVQRLTVNGVNLSVEVRGTGPAILFIHGYPFDRTIWKHQMDSLQGFRRIAPDLRGMGESDAPDLGYSMATYADDLYALLDALAVKEVVLCGLSMGGYIAFEFLRRWRRRVRRLVLIATRAEADSVEGRRNREAAIIAARERGASSVADAMLPRVLAPATKAKSPETVERIGAMMAATPVAGMVGALSAMRDRTDSTPLLPQLTNLPTLILVGEDDELTPPQRARAMAEAIPQARLLVIPAAAHLLPVEQPEETTAAMGEFLRGL